MSTRQKIAVLLILISAAFTVSCTKEAPINGTTQGASDENVQENEEATEDTAPALDERVSMYRASVYKDIKQSDWLATLNKGEQVVLVEELAETVTLKGKEEKIAKVRLSDDSEGYIRLRYLADKAVVITDDEVPVYNRNNKTSGQRGILPKGTIAFVVDQKANWLKVTVGELRDGTKVYDKWLENGYSEDMSLVSDAVMIEQSADVLLGLREGDAEAARVILEEVANKGNEMSFVAQMYLEGSAGSEPYEYSDGAVLAKVSASNLRIRTEPNTDAEQVATAPQNKIVEVLEQQDQEVEIDGTTGVWMKVNYEGTEGWAFGAFLDPLDG